LNKPFCSGMHWYVDFKDPQPASRTEPSLFEWAGGLPALARMSELFYEKYVPADPELASLFADMPPDQSDRAAVFLAEGFRGPKLDGDRYGNGQQPTRLISQGTGADLTEPVRARWVSLMLRCAQEAGLPGDASFRSALAGYLEWDSRTPAYSQAGTAEPQGSR